MMVDADNRLANPRESHSFAPLGLVCSAVFPHGLRRGAAFLRRFAAIFGRLTPIAAG